MHRILYLLFTEGHLSSHADVAIRRELCDEALRLATILATHPVGATPETFALLSLMHLHVALGGRPRRSAPTKRRYGGGESLLRDRVRIGSVTCGAESPLAPAATYFDQLMMDWNWGEP